MIFYIIIFLYGIIFGSFYNVCIARIPKGISIITPPSHCPKCKSKIKWYQNIPLLSYIFLGGKCHVCKLKISFIYPFIELTTGIMAVLVAMRFQSPSVYDSVLKTLIYFTFCSSLLIISAIDIRFYIIPDRFSAGGIIFGIICSTLYPELHGFKTMPEGFIFSFISFIICFATLNSVRVAGSYIYRREAMGYGDIKLVGAFGALLGWKAGLLSIFFGACLGSVAGILSVIFSGLNIKSEIPFGPFLAGGAFISLFYGNEFINWYLNLFCYI